MTEPTTSNVALIVPNNGDLVDTWGSGALNPDFVALDGFIGGVATIALSSTNVTLTAPSGTISPTAGPSQSQNAIIKLTGTLTANVKVTLPLPGIQRVYNATAGNFVVTLAAASSGNIVGVPQGCLTEVFNDGTNVYFCNLGGYPGKLDFYGGLSAMPAWITACTVPPYLLADGTVYNIATFPALGALYGSKFGGNGISTFGVQDLQGRVPLAYDGTGTRIVTADCGINGQTMGAAGGIDGVVLDVTQLPSHDHGGNTGSTKPTIHGNAQTSSTNDGGRNHGLLDNFLFGDGTSGIGYGNVDAHVHTVSAQGGGLVHSNVQPAQVAGIWMVKT